MLKAGVHMNSRTTHKAMFVTDVLIVMQSALQVAMLCYTLLAEMSATVQTYPEDLPLMQAVDFKKALGCKRVGVLDMGAGSGLLSMMAARYDR